MGATTDLKFLRIDSGRCMLKAEMKLRAERMGSSIWGQLVYLNEYFITVNIQNFKMRQNQPCSDCT